LTVRHLLRVAGNLWAELAQLGSTKHARCIPTLIIPTLMKPIALTQFSHGGGCGCKIAPGLLTEILARAPQGLVPPELLVGTETSDDAAVYRLNDTQALVATTDFFTPIVDDARDFGRIAAANALSDIYAMGGTPIMALALVGMPIAKLPPEIIGQVLEGGASICREAGIPIAGGHSIDVLEPIYGLVGLGLVHPDRVRRNSDAQAGDVLVLGKPLGIGILSAALKKGVLDASGYAEMIRHTTQLNKVGIALAGLDGVHAMTDVTGFGLAGHLLEICRGSALSAQVQLKDLPLIETAVGFAKQNIVTGASARNWSSYGTQIAWDSSAGEWQRALISDPQTSGGLLVSCHPDSVSSVLDAFHAAGFQQAAAIGRMGEAQVAEGTLSFIPG
jgi:selenide,water dikinase